MSETQTVTIADFLLARIAEDEAAARLVLEPYGDHAAKNDAAWWGDERVWWRDHRLSSDETSLLTRMTPQRVLSECEAKRQIVEDFMVYAADYRDAPSDFAAGRRHAALLAVTRLVEPYADHPDFDPDWRP